MTEIEHLGKRINTIKDGIVDKSGLVRTVYDVATTTGGHFVGYDERLRFI